MTDPTQALADAARALIRHDKAADQREGLENSTELQLLEDALEEYDESRKPTGFTHIQAGTLEELDKKVKAYEDSRLLDRAKRAQVTVSRWGGPEPDELFLLLSGLIDKLEAKQP